MISQHWFRQWLGAVRQQAITLANVDLCRHVASVGHNELTFLCRRGMTGGELGAISVSDKTS